MSGAATEERSVPQWVWIGAFLVGVAFLTLVRPVLQRIPEPPPELGPLPVVSGLGMDGASAAVGGPGGIRLVQILPTGGAPDEASRTMRKLGYVFSAMGRPAVERVTVVESGVAGPRKAALGAAQASGGSWPHVGVERAEFARWVSSLPGMEEAADVGAFVALVDSRGNVRGWYGVGSPEVVSEVYHRAVHADRSSNVDRTGP